MPSGLWSATKPPSCRALCDQRPRDRNPRNNYWDPKKNMICSIGRTMFSKAPGRPGSLTRWSGDVFHQYLSFHNSPEHSPWCHDSWYAVKNPRNPKQWIQTMVTLVIKITRRIVYVTIWDVWNHGKCFKNLPEVSWGVLLSILNPENRFPPKSQILFFLALSNWPVTRSLITEISWLV